MKRCSASLQADSLPSVPTGKPNNTGLVAYPFFRGSSWPRNQTGVSCIAGGFLLAYQGSLIKVSQSCPTLCDLMDRSLPGSSVYGILQARILEWVAFPFSRGSSQTSDWTQVSHTAGGSLPPEPPGKPKNTEMGSLSFSSEDPPDPGIELGSPALQADSLPAELSGKPQYYQRSANQTYNEVSPHTS